METDRARRLLSNLRSPINTAPPTVTNEVVRQAVSELLLIPRPATRIVLDESSVTGPVKPLLSHRLVSSVVRHVKGSERSLSQWINCYASNAGTSCDSLEAATLRGRLADSQCHSRGSESVVVGGVTTIQGAGEMPAQGEGTYRPTVPQTTATGSTMLHHGARRP